jgi:hypothetical protein
MVGTPSPFAGILMGHGIAVYQKQLPCRCLIFELAASLRLGTDTGNKSFLQEIPLQISILQLVVICINIHRLSAKITANAIGSEDSL